MRGVIHSMTGFSAQECALECGTLLLELRAVNHRYLELHFRMDDTVRSLEPMARELISSRLARGKVECRIALMESHANPAEIRLDDAMLARLALLSGEVRQHFPDSRSLSVADVLRWPGVIAGGAMNNEALATSLRQTLLGALDDLAQTRAREGEKMRQFILARVAEMEDQVARVRPLLPALIAAYQEKLAARLHEVMQQNEDDRVRQELTLFMQKIDVDEELGRLTAHLEEVRRILAAGGAVGKRLDFLMQELNREANTLGSKSAATETSQVAMTLKVLIEQMREQIQNLE